MYLTQTIVDFTPLIKALTDAGVTGLLLVAILVGLPGFLLVRMILDRNAKTQDALVAAINMLTQNQNSMQAGALRRDDQIDRMNELEEKRVTATTDQNKLLQDQNKLLSDLKGATESGHGFTRNLVDSVVATSKDTSTAMQTIEANVLKRFDTLPTELAKAIEPSLQHISEAIGAIVDPDMAKKVVEQLKPDVAAMFDEVLKKCLEQNAAKDAELKGLTDALDDTAHKLTEAERARVTAVIPEHPEPPDGPKKVAPLPKSDDKPTDGLLENAA